MVVDSGLMLTIAQVSATFVAIVSGFYTSKILSLSSEKQRIRNKISEIAAEYNVRTSIAKHYQDRVDEHFTDQAKKDVDDFTRDLLVELELKEYTLPEMLAKYVELEAVEPDQDTRVRLTTELPNINKKISDELRNRGANAPEANLPLGLRASQADMNLLRSSVATAVASHPAILEATRQSHTLLAEWASKRDDEHAQMRILASLKKDQENELKSVSLPRHIRFGYLSQLVFAVTGVVMPLTYGSWSGYLGDNANVFALLLFGAGLITMFAYIFSEVRAALLINKPEAESSSVKQIET